MRVCFFAVFISMLPLIYGCGGGGGGSTPATSAGTTISGTVSAPAGGSALGRAAGREAAATGLTARSGVTVSLYNIDDSGATTGAVLTTAATNASGVYSLTLPSGVSAASNLIVQVGSGGNVMRAFVTGTSINVNPLTELVVTKITADVQPLSSFTTTEISTIQAQVNTDGASTDFTSHTTVSAAVTAAYAGTIKTNLDSGIQSASGNTAPVAVTLSTPGSATSSSLTLSWTSSPESDFANYKIYYSTATGVSTSSTLLTTITSSATLSYQATGLTASTAYYFKVYVCDTGGLCTGSSEVSASTSALSLSLTKGTAVQLATSSVFPGIVHDGSRLVISYASGNNLYVRPYDTNFTALAAATQLTTSGDVMDHKHIFFQNAHYLLYSTMGDDDLYLIKLDTSLAQVGTTVTVASNSTTTRTNDMLLATDGTYILTGQYRPSDLNNNETSGHLIKKYDTSLNYVSPDITANALQHVNTASLLQVGDYMYIVAPNPVLGQTVQTTRDLILVRFNSSWSAVDSSAIELVDYATLTHSANGDGIWMSTGLAYDSQTNKLIVGHTFSQASGGSDTGYIYLRVFDGTTFSQISSEIMVDSLYANRAHFLLLGDTLYVVYDDSTSGSPTTYGLKYTLTRS